MMDLSVKGIAWCQVRLEVNEDMTAIKVIVCTKRKVTRVEITLKESAVPFSSHPKSKISGSKRYRKVIRVSSHRKLMSTISLNLQKSVTALHSYSNQTTLERNKKL